MSRLRKLRKAAKRFLEKGWRFVPAPPDKKGPRIKGWPDLRIKEAKFDEYFSEDSNICLLTGEPSGGLIDVDLDCPEAIALADQFLPYTGRIHGRKSKPKSHRWYTAAPIPASEKFDDLDGTCLLELLSTRRATVVPPSIHYPSGEPIRWASRKPPAKVDGGEIRKAVACLAGLTLIARHWPEKGSRDAVAMALAGMLLRAGWDELEVGDFVAVVARAANDEEWVIRKAVARTTKKRLKKDEPATGRQRLAEIMGADVVDRACQWLGIESNRTWSPRLARQTVPWPDPLAEEAFYGLAGDIVRTVAPETESDPAGLLLQFLTGFGNLIGRNVYLQVGATRHYVNLYTGLVGQTSRSRKGTSWNEVFRLLSDVDPDWARDRKVPGGLSSGEGLIWAVRDAPEEAPEPAKAVTGESDGADGEDEGVDDKRLIIVESEFASTLRVMGREKNILSSVLRAAWDSGDLNNLTKNSPARATAAHISLIVHITQDELRRELTATDMANGFANRFLWGCVRRARLLPFGGHVHTSALKKLVGRLRAAAAFAQQPIRMRRAKRARKLWKKTYPSLTAEVSGLLGAVISRAEAQVVRLAMLYALLDRSRFIEKCHLSAALAVWRYCEDSARYIFGDALGDPLADTILRELRRQPNGLTRSEIRETFKRNRSEAEISRALSSLLEGGWVSCTPEQTGGRPAERWTATR
jgi:hypothetical protein